jgi:mRNA interferase MazF
VASRGEVWVVDLKPTEGREQRGTRPVVVVSDDALNHGRAQLVVVVPLTRTDRGIPLHVRIDPPEGGLRDTSFAMCEMVRSVSTTRLRAQWGALEKRTMAMVEDRLRIVLRL